LHSTLKDSPSQQLIIGEEQGIGSAFAASSYVSLYGFLWTRGMVIHIYPFHWRESHTYRYINIHPLWYFLWLVVLSPYHTIQSELSWGCSQWVGHFILYHYGRGIGIDWCHYGIRSVQRHVPSQLGRQTWSLINHNQIL
jgi:hypothetical protein